MKPVTEGFICCYTFHRVMAKTNTSHGRFVWKAIAIAVIVLFILIVAVGEFRDYRFKSEFRSEHHSAQPEQIDLAKKSVSLFLTSHNDNITKYNISVQDIRTMGIDDSKRNIIQVTLYKSSVMQQYLVDTDSGNVVLRTETDFYNWTRSPVSRVMPRESWMPTSMMNWFRW